MRFLIIMLTALVLPGPQTVRTAAAEDVQKAAFFGFLLINTSLEDVTEEERARVTLVDERLQEGLEASGRYQMIDIAPVANKTKLYANLADCNGCDTDLAAELGADVAVTAEIQKTSNLILGMTIYIREAGTGRLIAGGSADMRGNNDAMWLRTVRYILKNRLLKG